MLSSSCLIQPGWTGDSVSERLEQTTECPGFDTVCCQNSVFTVIYKLYALLQIPCVGRHFLIFTIFFKTTELISSTYRMLTVWRQGFEFWLLLLTEYHRVQVISLNLRQIFYTGGNSAHWVATQAAFGSAYTQVKFISLHFLAPGAHSVRSKGESIGFLIYRKAFW